MMTYEPSPSLALPERYYRAVFDALPGNHVLIKADAPRYTILAATASHLAQTGRAKESVIGKGTFEAFPGSDTDAANTGVKALEASYQYVLATKQSHALPVQRYDLQAEDGSFTERYWRAGNSPVFGPDGEVAYIIHSSEDITHEIKAREQEEKIKGLEQAYNLFMQAPFAIHIFTGPELTIDLANPPTLELWGKTEDVTGKHFLEVLPELKGQGFEVMMQEVMQTGITRFYYEVPLTLNRPGKETTGYFNFVYQPYYKEGASKAESVLIIAHEVTEQVRVKKSIEESEARLKAIVHQTPAPTLVLRGDDFRIDHINGPMLAMMGNEADVTGQPLLSLMPELEGQFAWQQVQRVYREGISFDQPKVLVRHKRAGLMQDYHYDVSYRPLLEEGRVTGVIQVAIDVTAQVRAQQELARTQRQLQAIFEQSPAAIAILGKNKLEIEQANPFYSEIVGRKREDILGKPLLEALPEVAGQGFDELMQTVIESGVAVTASEMPAQLRRNGRLEQIFVDFSYNPVREADGSISGVFVVATDVTQQVVARKAIQESEENLRNMVLNAPVGMCVIDAASLVSEIANESYIEIAGKPYEAIVGQKHWESFAEAKPYYEAALQEVIEKGIPFYANEVELMLIRHGKEEILYATFVYLPMKNSEGDVTKVAVYVLENTPQVMARRQVEKLVSQRTRELAEANEALHDINKELQRSNANLEEFAHAASHDLKEPIRKISFFIHQLKSQLAAHLQEAELRSFGRIENATERMGNLIDDLLLYSHVSQRPLEMDTVDLNIKLQRVLEDLELDIQEKAAVINVATLPVVKGYRRQLQQLFQNLISNALKYSKTQVPPRIDITAEPHEKEGKRYHLIKVKDNGIGFEQQHDEKIFQMFARLHGRAEYSGTGVGLSIVKKVVENHNGLIRVKSEVGEGSVFMIYFPA